MAWGETIMIAWLGAAGALPKFEARSAVGVLAGAWSCSPESPEGCLESSEGQPLVAESSQHFDYADGISQYQTTAR